MKSYVLDASALLSFLQGAGGSEKIRELLEHGQQGDASIAMCAVNWGEVYYASYRRLDRKQVEEVRQAVRQFPISMVSADLRLAEVAAEIKIRHKLAYSDCFAAALALERHAILVTSDRDFKRIQGRVRIMWVLSH